MYDIYIYLIAKYIGRPFADANVVMYNLMQRYRLNLTLIAQFLVDHEKKRGKLITVVCAGGSTWDINIICRQIMAAMIDVRPNISLMNMIPISYKIDTDFELMANDRLLDEFIPLSTTVRDSIPATLARILNSAEFVANTPSRYTAAMALIIVAYDILTILGIPTMIMFGNCGRMIKTTYVEYVWLNIACSAGYYNFDIIGQCLPIQNVVSLNVMRHYEEYKYSYNALTINAAMYSHMIHSTQSWNTNLFGLQAFHVLKYRVLYRIINALYG